MVTRLIELIQIITSSLYGHISNSSPNTPQIKTLNPRPIGSEFHNLGTVHSKICTEKQRISLITNDCESKEENMKYNTVLLSGHIGPT